MIYVTVDFFVLHNSVVLTWMAWTSYLYYYMYLEF